MSKKEFDYNAVSKIVNLYNLDEKAGNTAMYEYLKKYITRIMYNPNYSSYSKKAKYHDDIVQSIAENVCLGMKLYNLDEGAPTTFFQPYIYAGIRQAIDADAGQTAYYGSISKKIKQLIEKRLKMGLSTSLDDCILELSDLSPTSVTQAYMQTYAIDNSFSLNGMATNEDFDSFDIPVYATPESLYLKREEHKDLYRCLGSLSVKERNVVILLFKLYNSSMYLLLDILYDLSYDSVEILKINHYQTAEILSAAGFTKSKMLKFYGLTDEEIARYTEIINNPAGHTDELFAMQERIQQQDVTLEQILSFAADNGMDVVEVQRRLSQKAKKEKPVTACDNAELILKARGFSEKEINKILYSAVDKNPRHAVAHILGISPQDVKSTQINALNRLQTVLKNKNSYHDQVRASILNNSPLPVTDNARNYAEDCLDIFTELDF